MNQREIKFRARRSDIDRWVFGHYFQTPITDENSGTSPDKGWFFLTGETRHCIQQDTVSFVIDEKTLGQFTGLLDKNGKPIFEGDVVRADDSVNGFIDFHAGRFCWTDGAGHWDILFGKDGPPESYPKRIRSLEIIGNIYENPELLKVKEDN